MTVEQIRTVWAHVTMYPLATVRGLSEQTGISRTKIFGILQFLEMAGYIKHVPHCTGRIVLMPLMDAKLDQAKK